MPTHQVGTGLKALIREKGWVGSKLTCEKLQIGSGRVNPNSADQLELTALIESLGQLYIFF